MSDYRLHDWIRYVQTQAEKIDEDVVGNDGGANKSNGTKQSRTRQRPETRTELLDRLVNPQISLHEASILLRVCPATVRKYTRNGQLPDMRTAGGQRRFRFRDVMALARELDKK